MVALVLGIAVLGENLTAAAIVGLVLIAVGAWLAASGHVSRRPGQARGRSGEPSQQAARLRPPRLRRSTRLDGGPLGSGRPHRARRRAARRQEVDHATRIEPQA